MKQIIHCCIEGLTSYAAERYVGFETHQPNGVLLAPALRNQRIRSLIESMSAFYQLSSNVESDFLKPFDERLAAAQSSFGVELTPLQLQREAVTGLWVYAEDLCRRERDPRQTLLQVRDQLEDMVGHLNWDLKQTDLSRARDWMYNALPRVTARQPIRFTRLLLGPETGPADSDFLAGAVKDADAVRDTRLYEEFCRRYPEKQDWPAICVTYQGGRGAVFLRDADELDLKIMREAGDRFLDLKDVAWIGGPYELHITNRPVLTHEEHGSSFAPQEPEFELLAFGGGTEIDLSDSLALML